MSKRSSRSLRPLPDAALRMMATVEFRIWAKESGIYSIPHRNLLKRNLENLGYRVRKVHGRPEVVGLSASRMPF